jgi:hypothetical protein
MGKNMNYIGSKRNEPSWNVEHKGKRTEPDIALCYFLKTPNGKLLINLLQKLYNAQEPHGVLGEIDEKDEDTVEHDINSSRRLTPQEKNQLRRVYHKYLIYAYQILTENAKHSRFHDVEYIDRPSYSHPVETDRGYFFESLVPVDTLDLPRKKKSASAKSKRKPAKKPSKKVVRKTKSCGCK